MKAVHIQNEACALIDAYGIPDVSRHIIVGGVRHALMAASHGAAMLVVGARGRSMLTGAVVGSVSQHLAHHAECPVVVVRGPSDLQNSRIVVGVDGSSGSDAALAFALDEASRLGVEVRVVHAYQLLSASAGSMGGYGLLTMRDELEAGERLAAESVAGWREKYPEVHLDVRSVPMHPVPALTEESRHAALLVLGAHGRGPFRRLLIGSVAQAMLHHARCPVAIAR